MLLSLAFERNKISQIYIILLMPIDFIFYFASIVIINAFYIAVHLGVFVAVPQYIVWWYTFVQVFLCCVLMYRYNPFRTKFEYSDFDARLIFGAACILLNNVLSVPVLLNYLDPLKKMGLVQHISTIITGP